MFKTNHFKNVIYSTRYHQLAMCAIEYCSFPDEANAQSNTIQDDVQSIKFVILPYYQIFTTDSHTRTYVENSFSDYVKKQYWLLEDTTDYHVLYRKWCSLRHWSWIDYIAILIHDLTSLMIDSTKVAYLSLTISFCQNFDSDL